MSGDSGSHCRVIWPGDVGFVAGLLLTSGSQVQCVGDRLSVAPVDILWSWPDRIQQAQRGKWSANNPVEPAECGNGSRLGQLGEGGGYPLGCAAIRECGGVGAGALHQRRVCGEHRE